MFRRGLYIVGAGVSKGFVFSFGPCKEVVCIYLGPVFRRSLCLVGILFLVGVSI